MKDNFNLDFNHDLALFKQRIDSFLAEQLKAIQDEDTELYDAMSYSLLLGGKRIRPILIYLIGDLLAVNPQSLDYLAAAIEAIHAYSLVHDDLPAMDDDYYRRGKECTHIKYGDALAILSGDALQTFAFELLAKTPNLKPLQIVYLVKILARSSGSLGMCLGQALDLKFENQNIDLAMLQKIHLNKTGALIKACAVMSFIASEYFSAPLLDKLLSNKEFYLTGKDLDLYENSQKLVAVLTYAHSLGLAFQIQDDILDVIGDKKETGKDVGKDEAMHKSTYPKLLGLENAQKRADDLILTAISALDLFANDGKNCNPKVLEKLKDLAYFVVKRHG